MTAGAYGHRCAGGVRLRLVGTWPTEYGVGMTRRRLILAACVAVVALGAAWWWFAVRLSADEHRLIGTWHPVAGIGQWTFGSDRQGHYTHVWSGPVSDDPTVPTMTFSCDYPAIWDLRGGVIVVDDELSFLGRIARSVHLFLGVRRNEPMRFVLESVTADELIVVPENGIREVWARDRGD